MLIVQLGANAILAVSLAVCKAGAGVLKTPLYQVAFSFRPQVLEDIIADSSTVSGTFRS